MSTFQNGATVYDASLNVIPGAVVQWESLNPSVATVSSTGLITAVATGKAVIRATCGSVQTACTVTVNPA